MKNKIRLGILGTIGSGKTFASSWFVKKGFECVIMGNLIRACAKKAGLTPTRQNLMKIQEKYRKKYGEDYFIKAAIQKLEKSNKKRLLIDGIRLPIDAKTAKKAGYKLILIDADPRLRFERLKKRRRIGFSRNLAEFKKEEAAEMRAFKFKTTIKFADIKILNNGTKEQFISALEKLLKKISR